MYAVVGTLFLAVAVFGFTIMTLASRKPNPPGWTQYWLIQEVVTIGAVSLGSTGIASVIHSIGFLKEQPLTVTQIILVTLIVIVFVFAWSRLKVGARLTEYEGQTRSATQRSASIPRPGVATDIIGTSSVTVAPEDPTTPTRPRTPHLPKKAA